MSEKGESDVAKSDYKHTPSSSQTVNEVTECGKDTFAHRFEGGNVSLFGSDHSRHIRRPFERPDESQAERVTLSRARSVSPQQRRKGFINSALTKSMPQLQNSRQSYNRAVGLHILESNSERKRQDGLQSAHDRAAELEMFLEGIE